MKCTCEECRAEELERKSHYIRDLGCIVAMFFGAAGLLIAGAVAIGLL